MPVVELMTILSLYLYKQKLVGCTRTGRRKPHSFEVLHATEKFRILLQHVTL
jgi:hypothetical protein